MALLMLFFAAPAGAQKTKSEATSVFINGKWVPVEKDTEKKLEEARRAAAAKENTAKQPAAKQSAANAAAGVGSGGTVVKGTPSGGRVNSSAASVKSAEEPAQSTYFHGMRISSVKKEEKKGYTYVAPKVRASEVILTPEELRSREDLRYCVGFLTDTICDGRGTGTRGAVESAAFIARRFERAGLRKMGDSWFHSFNAGNGRAGHNVVGMIPGRSGRYVVVTAYFDGLGHIGDTMYPGADANASGVAAMLQLLFTAPRTPSIGIIFVGLDGHNASLSGSSDLYEFLKGKQISLVMNLDILGSTLAPPDTSWPEFMMVLGGSGYSRALLQANRGADLHLYYDYYGSRDFTNMFYRKISDQKVFLEHGVPALMFTSGITANTNKASDSTEALDFGVLTKRVTLISNFLKDFVR